MYFLCQSTQPSSQLCLWQCSVTDKIFSHSIVNASQTGNKRFYQESTDKRLVNLGLSPRKFEMRELSPVVEDCLQIT